MKNVARFVCCWLLLTGCTSTASIKHRSLKQIPATLLGQFDDDYGSTYTITRKLWMHGSKAKYHLIEYNREGNFFIAKNDAANPSEAGLYSRIDVMYFEGMDPWRWGYCLTAYKARTVEEALQTAAADRGNPRKGCNGFPFSRMKASETPQKKNSGY